jgi:two-component system, sensor histidine kinase LadS
VLINTTIGGFLGKKIYYIFVLMIFENILMKKRLFTCFFLFFSSVTLWGQSCIVIDSTFSATSLSRYISTYTQAKDSSVIQPTKLPFQEYRSEELYFGTDNKTRWVSFECKNGSNNIIPLVLEVELVYATNVRFYIFQNDTLLQKSDRYSWKTPYYHRIIPSRYFACPIELSPQKQVRIIVSIQEDSGILFCPITLWSRPAYNYYYESFIILFMLPVSILLLVLMVEVFLSIIYRYQIVFYHALYTAGTLGYMLSAEGFLPQFAPDFIAGVEGYAICSYVMWIGYLMFTEHFFFFNNANLIWIKNSFYLLVIVLFVLLVATLLLPFKGLISTISLYPNSIIPIIILVGGFFATYYKLPNFKLYIVSLIPIFSSAILNILTDYEILPKNNAFYLFIYSAPVANIIVLAVGVLLHFIQERQQLFLNLSDKQQELIKTQETERTRIAQDLHDDLGGTLSAIKGKVANEMQNVETLNLVEKAIEDLRNISRNLLPAELAKNGLSKAIQQSIERLQSASKIAFTVIAFGKEKRMSEERELNIYRVISELLNNIVKHSKATKATVQVIFYDDYLHISVEDNGVGIKTEEINWGIGLKNVNSRIEFLKAKLLKDSNENGTTFIIEVSYV